MHTLSTLNALRSSGTMRLQRFSGWLSLLCASLLLAIPDHACCADLGNANTILLPGHTNIRGTVENMLLTILSYVALAAVVVIVIAGIMLVVGLGSDESKDKAKKIILYAIVGMILILLATAIVELVISL
ncbi:MAG: TrbC/VirB2 family protein [Candidatus Peregrinibacteria bacterium]